MPVVAEIHQLANVLGRSAASAAKVWYGSWAAVGQCLRLVCFRPVITGGTSPAFMSAFEK
jgi:hypothetical protein